MKNDEIMFRRLLCFKKPNDSHLSKSHRLKLKKKMEIVWFGLLFSTDMFLIVCVSFLK